MLDAGRISLTFSFIAAGKLFRKPCVQSWRRQQQKSGCPGAISTPQHTEIQVQPIMVQTYRGEDVPSVRRRRPRQSSEAASSYIAEGKYLVIYLQARPSQKQIISTGRSSYWLHLGEKLLVPRKASILPSNASVAGSVTFRGENGNVSVTVLKRCVTVL